LLTADDKDSPLSQSAIQFRVTRLNFVLSILIRIVTDILALAYRVRRVRYEPKTLFRGGPLAESPIHLIHRILYPVEDQRACVILGQLAKFQELRAVHRE
jgi:hypothetical protein